MTITKSGVRWTLALLSLYAQSVGWGLLMAPSASTIELLGAAIFPMMMAIGAGVIIWDDFAGDWGFFFTAIYTTASFGIFFLWGLFTDF